MGLRLVTAPTEEPVDLEMLASEGRLTAAQEYARMERYRVPARRSVEELLGRALLDQVWELVLPAFPCGCFELPRPPLIAIVSVSYVDTNGVTHTLASGTGYLLETTSGSTEAPTPARLHPPSGGSWPSTDAVPEAVIVRYRAGYGTTPAEVPDLLRLAVAQRAAQLYEGAIDDQAILALAGQYRVWTFA